MLPGKAVSRAIRGHIIVDSALKIHLLKLIVPTVGVHSHTTDVKGEDAIREVELNNIKAVYEVVRCDKLNVEVCSLLLECKALQLLMRNRPATDAIRM